MRRLITTSVMEVEWINAVWNWRLRALGHVCFASLSIALLMLSLARLLGVEVVKWPAAALCIIKSFGSAVLWFVPTTADTFEAIGLLKVA